MNEERIKNTIIFLLRFIILSIFIFPIVGFIDFSLLQSFLIKNLTVLLQFLGQDVYSDNGVLFVDETSFLINRQCLSIEIMTFLACLIFAVHSMKMRYKIFGIIICLPLLWFMNIVRIINLIHIRLNFGIEIAQSLHNFFWQFAIIGFAVGLWSIWLFSMPKQK
ncbi:MAG: exosortase/archaeosortase family protein [Candidatus Aenigmatarchaeota archaeon]